MVRVATCSCGRLRVSCEGDPVRISICHCLACQRRTGSVFGAQARFPRGAVRVDGASSTWVRTAEDGDRIEFRFCPTCGSTVSWEVESLPGFTAVAIGAFADPTFPSPAFSIYEARKHAWVAAPPGAQRME